MDTNDQVGRTDRALSPACRRAFLASLGRGALGAVGAIAVVAAVSACDDDDDEGSCGYCNGGGRNYSHCDGSYCNYGNYGDS